MSDVVKLCVVQGDTKNYWAILFYSLQS